MSEIGEEEIARALVAHFVNHTGFTTVSDEDDKPTVSACYGGHWIYLRVDRMAQDLMALLRPAIERAREEERAAAREAGSRIFAELVARGVDAEMMADAIEKLADESDAELAAIRKG